MTKKYIFLERFRLRRQNNHSRSYIITSWKQIFKFWDQIYCTNKNTIAPFTTTEIIKDLNASVFYVMTTDACNDKTEYVFTLKPCEIVFSWKKGFLIGLLWAKSFSDETSDTTANVSRDFLFCFYLGVHELKKLKVTESTRFCGRLMHCPYSE